MRKAEMMGFAEIVRQETTIKQRMIVTGLCAYCDDVVVDVGEAGVEAGSEAGIECYV